VPKYNHLNQISLAYSTLTEMGWTCLLGTNDKRYWSESYNLCQQLSPVSIDIFSFSHKNRGSLGIQQILYNHQSKSESRFTLYVDLYQFADNLYSIQRDNLSSKAVCTVNTPKLIARVTENQGIPYKNQEPLWYIPHYTLRRDEQSVVLCVIDILSLLS